MSTAATPTYPLKTIARLLKISERRVQQLSKDGVIPRAERGRYELAPAVQGYVSFLQDRIAGNPDPSEEAADFQASRARKMAAEAALAEIELCKARDEVVELAHVEKVVGGALATTRARLLQVGAKVAPQADLITDAASLKEMIDDAIHEALNEISSGALEYAGTADDDDPGEDHGAARPDDDAAAEADAERMG